MSRAEAVLADVFPPPSALTIDDARFANTPRCQRLRTDGRTQCRRYSRKGDCGGHDFGPGAMYSPAQLGAAAAPRGPRKKPGRAPGGPRFLTLGIFLERVAARGDQYDYRLVEITRGGQTKVTIICRTHGQFVQRADRHLAGQGCTPCYKGKAAERMRNLDRDYLSRTRTQVIDEVDGLFGKGQYTLLGDVGDEVRVTRSTAVQVTCNTAGHGVWGTDVDHLLLGHGCPNCRASKGERAVRCVLEAAGVSFETEVGFPDLRDKRPLRYDFAIPGQRVLIEFDGAFHFAPLAYRELSSEAVGELWESMQRRDRLKDEWPPLHGWRLVRLRDTATVEADLRKAGVITAA